MSFMGCLREVRAIAIGIGQCCLELKTMLRLDAMLYFQNLVVIQLKVAILLNYAQNSCCQD